jgi:hypothetical protein
MNASFFGLTAFATYPARAIAMQGFAAVAAVTGRLAA